MSQWSWTARLETRCGCSRVVNICERVPCLRVALRDAPAPAVPPSPCVHPHDQPTSASANSQPPAVESRIFQIAGVDGSILVYREVATG